ncbi:hypothetical protein [Streptomyces sp. NPDC058657]|uniref:hypothetical protein n=1 Tax=unclassified Streptomyces TaxID=2593676 RepID=UPI003652C3A9
MADQMPAAHPALSAENLEALTLDERADLFSRALTDEERDALDGMLPRELVLESRVLWVVTEMNAHGAVATPEEIRLVAAERVDRLPDAGLPLRNDAQWRSGEDSHMEIDLCRLMAQLPAGPLADLLAALPTDQQRRLRSALATRLAGHTPPPDAATAAGGGSSADGFQHRWERLADGTV